MRHAGTTLTIEERAAFCPSINAWLVLGPFDCPFAAQMETDFIDPHAPVDPEVAVGHAGGPARRWRPVLRRLRAGDDPRDEHRIDLNALFGASTERAIEHAVAYAACDLHSEQRQEVELALGSDDSVVAWLNGREVHRSDAIRAYRPREDRVLVTLDRGPNRLLLKIGNNTLGWCFGAHVDDLGGLPAPGIRVSLPG